MGCDIHSYAERKNSDGKWEIVPNVSSFDSRSYSVFGFLADVRNYSEVTPISYPRGFPDDASTEVLNEYKNWACDAHNASYLTVSELVAFNYDILCEDRRVMRNGNGGSTCEPGEGVVQTYREFLGEWFFKDLLELQESGAERIVFWFDN